MNYAIIRIDSGQLIDICPNLATSKVWTDKYDIMTAVPIEGNNHLEVRYLELSDPHGYGCDCPELESYGKPVELAKYLTKFIQHSTHAFGPDIRDIKDYLRHCSVTIDGHPWDNWSKLVDSILKKATIYV